LLHCTRVDENSPFCHRASVSRNLILLLLAGVSTPALAQRTTANAVTASDDAFGRSVGSERIGIYSQEDVRGFNPVEAGNVRVEGLYFDQQAQLSMRLVDSSAIRVGYASRGYPFPAPTGIVDLKIEKYEGQKLVSFEFDAETTGGYSGSTIVKMPIVEGKLGFQAGAGFRSGKEPYGRFGNFNSLAVGLNWAPYQGAEVIAFWGNFSGSDLQVSPLFFPAGNFTPPKFDRTANYGQPWAKNTNKLFNTGLIGKFPIGAFKLEAGLFRSVRREVASFADLEQGVSETGTVANRVIVADDGNRGESTSGELRLSRVWQNSSFRHTLIASVKGRDQSRLFGGNQRISLGASTSIAFDTRVKPLLAFGPNDESMVRQFTYGLGYNGVWKDRGTFGIAVQKSSYRKRTVFANTALSPTESKDNPWLFSVNGSVNILPNLIGYGGYVKGLEESPVAPDIATNRNEAPPAIITKQMDAGIRFAISPKLSFIVGVFEVKKPYFGVDPARLFRQLGTVSNRGVELSLAGSLAPGLSVVAGTLLLDPKISGSEVDAGLIGSRPVGSYKRRSILNLDWKPGNKGPWSFDIALDSLSEATGNAANKFSAPARQTVALGARYRFQLGSAKLLLRAQLQNMFDDFGWRVSTSGGFTPTSPRSFQMNLVADF
jgi:iron complex outermembrane recepter protein